MSNVDKLKYNGVEYDLGKSIDASLTQSGQPADAKVVGEALNSKIDKIDGKGLSSNDYTANEKAKLAGIENGANKTLIDTTLVNTGQAADAKSVGDAIASQNTNINTIKERTDNVEGNITTLQNNKVDKTTPLLNFDDTATDPLTDDGALANALTALGVLSDVIPAGGGMLYLKKALTELAEAFNPTPTIVTYTTNNGTITVRYKKIGVFVISTWTITPSSSWGTGAGNRITCTFDNQIPIPASVFTGVELNGVFAHINSGKTFRAQNNTGGSLGAGNSFDVSIAYFTTNP